ncbi:MAG: FecR domain-containing protein [Aureliella sp.]
MANSERAEGANPLDLQRLDLQRLDLQRLDTLMSAWLDGRLQKHESVELQAVLRGSKEARQLFLEYCQLDASVRQLADVDSFFDKEANYVTPASRETGRAHWSRGMVAAVVGCALVAASLASWAWLTPSDDAIATVMRMSGAFRWTGDAGKVSYDLQAGQELTGGTLDGLSPESWIELQFRDGTSVTVSGNSMLTFADDGQKVLHLKSGSLSANVEKQPVGCPMVVHTRSATLTVLGTSFGVDAALPATSVRVSEGVVRVKRTSDGKSIEVPANHRVVAAADRELQRTQLTAYVDSWTGAIGRRAGGPFGEWVPGTETHPAMLKAVHFVPEEVPDVTLYIVGIGVESAEHAPVRMRGETAFYLQGQLKFETDLYVGFAVRDERGNFAGKFLARCPAIQFSGRDFAAEVSLEEFGLDPTLDAYRDKLPASPEGLLVTSAWCFTIGEKPSGLAVSQFDLASAQSDSESGPMK